MAINNPNSDLKVLTRSTFLRQIKKPREHHLAVMLSGTSVSGFTLIVDFDDQVARRIGKRRVRRQRSKLQDLEGGATKLKLAEMGERPSPGPSGHPLPEGEG